MAEEHSITEVKEFFGYAKNADFIRDWKELSATDKEQLREGIYNAVP